MPAQAFSPTYQHFCPFLKTVGEVQGVLIAAHDMLDGIATQLGGVALTERLVFLRAQLRGFINVLAKMDQAQPATGIGPVQKNMCDMVQAAFSEVSKHFQDPGALVFINDFLLVNEAARTSASPSQPSPKLRVGALVFGTLVVAGSVAAIFWTRSSSPSAR